jgi:hypothetical protein
MFDALRKKGCLREEENAVFSNRRSPKRFAQDARGPRGESLCSDGKQCFEKVGLS